MHICKKNKYMFYFLIIALLFFIIIYSAIFTVKSCAGSILSPGTKPSFELINRNHGLSNLSVSAIIQDKHGFLWFGTQGGLNCYNGREMTVYRNNPFKEDGLVHNLIQTMYYDKENHELWIGTYQGVSRFFIANKKFINYTAEDNGLSDPVVIAITKDKQNNVWIGTMDGLNKLNPQTGNIKHYDIQGDTVRSLKIDSQERLLIGTYKGLFYYDYKKDNIKKFQLDLPSSYVMVIREYKKGKLTLGLWGGGIAEVNLKTAKIKNKVFKDNRVYALIKTRDGTKWVGTWGGGLYAIAEDGKTYHFSGLGVDQSLPHPIVYSMLQDYSDTLWIGTNGGGLCKVNPRKRNYVQFSHDVKNPDSLSAGKINSIFRDRKDNLWIAVYNSGLNRYNPVKEEMTKYQYNPDDPDSLPDNHVKDIIETGDGKVLFGTSVGIVYYDYRTKIFEKMSILPEDTYVYCLEEDANSNLWIGTYTNGVFYYNKSTKELKHYQYTSTGKYHLSNNLVYDILYDSQKRVWVATNNGLNLLNPDKEKFEIYHKVPGNFNQLASNIMRTLYEDSQGRIWIGMNGGGIALYNEKEGIFKSYTENNGLSSNIVIGILEGDDGRIWASTHNGISIIDPDNSEIYVLSPDDGIGGWEFNSGHFKDKDETLLFGGVHGITAIPESYTNQDIKPPRVYITNIDLYQNSIDSNRSFFNGAHLNFGYKDTFLGFKFVAIDYDTPEKIVFSYKLEGFDGEWIHAGTRDYASYSNLTPGEYQLKVFAETPRGVQSDVASVYFTINKPWFKTYIAYLFYGIAFLLLIYVIAKIREGYLLNQKNSELANINGKLQQANQELEKLSTKDDLTGLYNRRYFNAKIEELLNLARRSDAYLTLIMLDVDKFKSINDTFGHLIGDYYLADISKAIRKQLPRSTDFVVRYGGDEFAVVLYDTDKDGAFKVAEDIKNAVDNVAVRSESSSSKNITTTVSLGLISVIPDKSTSTRELIKVADQALYRAKQEGRNRICTDERVNNNTD